MRVDDLFGHERIPADGGPCQPLVAAVRFEHPMARQGAGVSVAWARTHSLTESLRSTSDRLAGSGCPAAIRRSADMEVIWVPALDGERSASLFCSGGRITPPILQEWRAWFRGDGVP